MCERSLSVSIPIILHQLLAGWIYALQSLVLIFNKRRTLRRVAGHKSRIILEQDCRRVWSSISMYQCVLWAERIQCVSWCFSKRTMWRRNWRTSNRMVTWRQTIEGINCKSPDFTKCTPIFEMSGHDQKRILLALMEYYHVVPTSAITQLCNGRHPTTGPTHISVPLDDLLWCWSKNSDTMMQTEINEAIRGLIAFVRPGIDPSSCVRCSYYSLFPSVIFWNAGSENVNGVYTLQMTGRDKNTSASMWCVGTTHWSSSRCRHAPPGTDKSGSLPRSWCGAHRLENCHGWERWEWADCTADAAMLEKFGERVIFTGIWWWHYQ